MVRTNRGAPVAQRFVRGINWAWAAVCTGALAAYVYVATLVDVGDRRMRSRLRLAEDTGAGLVEYILIILVVAILAIAFLTVFRNNIGNGFNRAGSCVNGNVNSGNC